MSEKKKVVILGAGIGGLSAGYFLARTDKFDVTIVEQAPSIGGMCASFEHNNFVLDYGAHKLYSVIPGVLDEIRQLMGDRLIELPKKNRLYLRGHLVDYPLSMGNLAQVLGFAVFLKLGLGYAVTLLKGLFTRRPAASYEEYIIRRFGRPAYELVFEPLADKVWGKPSELHPEMARTRVPASGGLEIILKLLGLKKETAETNAEFFYYPQKGFGDFPLAMKEQVEALGGRVIVNAGVEKVQCEDNHISEVSITTQDGSMALPCDYLVSSIPLPVLERMVFAQPDTTQNTVAEALQFRHLILVYVFVKKPMVLEDQWIFFPERKYIFSRIFEQKQMNPDLGPADQTAICCDFTCEDGDEIWTASDEELANKCVEGLVAAGFIDAEDVVDHLVLKRTNFYPRYDLTYVEKMVAVDQRLQQVDNLLLTGRIGMYNYNNSDHCTDMGRFIAEKLSNGQAPNKIWDALAERVRDYKIVD